MNSYFTQLPGLRKRRIRERGWKTEMWVSFGLLPLLAVTSFGQIPAAKPFAQGGKVTPAPFSHVYMFSCLRKIIWISAKEPSSWNARIHRSCMTDIRRCWVLHPQSLPRSGQVRVAWTPG